MKDHIVLRNIARLLIPFIIMFGLYVQFHGDYSPGGGFQAGVVCASALILLALIYGIDELAKIMPFWLVKITAAIGVLIYGMTGVATMLKGGSFLNYSVLGASTVKGQQLGIMLIELGVGLTVFSVMLVIFYSFNSKRSE